MKIKSAIIGSTGYTGKELIKILLNHPYVEIGHLVSRRFVGVKISGIHKELVGKIDKKCEKLDIKKISKNTDVAFLALPNGLSQNIAYKLLENGCKKVIDLSADFRLKEKNSYKKWYGIKHQDPLLLKKSLYGLPEIYNSEEKKKFYAQTKLIANPGCYATSIILTLAPVVYKKYVNPEIFRC